MNYSFWTGLINFLWCLNVGNQRLLFRVCCFSINQFVLMAVCCYAWNYNGDLVEYCSLFSHLARDSNIKKYDLPARRDAKGDKGLCANQDLLLMSERLTKICGIYSKHPSILQYLYDYMLSYSCWPVHFKISNRIHTHLVFVDTHTLHLLEILHWETNHILE